MASKKHHPRALIEVFKFVDSFHALVYIATVCKSWHHAVNERELWLHYVTTHFPHDDSIIAPTVKDTQVNYMYAILRCTLLVNVDWNIGIVEVYDVGAKTYISRRMDHYPFACPSWCPIGRHNVLICGGFNLKSPTEPSSSLSAILSLDDFALTPKESMNHGKYRHALVPYGRFIYSFGGRMAEEGAHCEKFNVVGESWNMIASMKVARYSVSPAIFQSKVYIVGGGSGADVLDLYTEQFSFIELSKPIRSGCSAVSSQSCIYILHDEEISAWTPPSSELQQRASVMQCQWFSPSPVCKFENSVLIITDFGVKAFDLSSLTVRDVDRSVWHSK